jgi:hypothetical protein
MARVRVIATTFGGTRAALAAAVPMARGLGADLSVIVPRIVSCDAEVEAPPASTAFLAERYRDIAREFGAEARVEITPSIGIDAFLTTICADHSLVIVGGPTGRWLTSPEERFADRLAAAGCQVLFAASGAHTTQRRTAA